ncbi:glycosyl hydrolase 53 family protein [Microbacterium sp. 179-B 1A2 NHS]|uniref:glycosyl hydrolase 53 family protein n=1 Tax=Microbacterium sp. 179-B 1A2 NHS TaxID=3142383 RepID=UPI0039A2057C
MTTRHFFRAIAVSAAAALALGTSAHAASAREAGPVDAGIFVQKVEGLPTDFARGVDVSSYLSLIDSGVVFRDERGRKANLFEVLADAGVTDVRLRVWNDPYNSETGDGYGGGTVDAERAADMGRLATKAGLGVLVDFHYSDFWADPAKQKAPKAWAGLDIDEKVAATTEYTTESLTLMRDAGVDVEMVQVGNETTSGVAGETSWVNMSRIFQAGSTAVRDVFPDALVAVHYTNPEQGRYPDFAGYLQDNAVDYDVFASSYYPYWHGTLENLTRELSTIATRFGKKVMVAETSWAHTLVDADGHPNVIDLPEEATQYPVSVQGQARALRDVIAAVNDVPGGAGIGVYYWEPAWLPVGPPRELAANRILWERDGSGWASSAAGEYDPEDAGEYYGGSAWDNQALFAADGRPLESLSTFEYVYTGATTERAIESHDPVTLTVTDAADIALPETVTLRYNDLSSAQVGVEWSDAVSWITSPGEYTVTGVAAGGYPVSAAIVVTANLLADPDFEGASPTPWTVTGSGGAIDWSADATSGDRAFRFWSDATYSTTVTQTVTGLEPGEYTLSAVAHGGGFTAGTATLRAVTSAGTFETPLRLTAWGEHNPSQVTVTVGASGEAVVSGSLESVGAGTWGVFDDFALVAAGGAGDVDTTALAALVDRAAEIDRSRYTDASLADLDRALEKARVVLAASRPTEEQVSAASVLVSDAIDALALIDPPDPAIEASTPKVTGSFVVGEKVRVRVDSSPRSAKRSYQWFADGAAIRGADSARYTIGKAIGGAQLSVRVTLAKRGYQTVTVSSEPVTVLKTFAAVSTPRIEGKAVAGATLSASVRVKPGADAIAYRWKVDGRAVAGASGAVYTVKNADAGKRVTVTVTVSKRGYESVSTTSAAVRIRR